MIYHLIIIRDIMDSCWTLQFIKWYIMGDNDRQRADIRMWLFFRVEQHLCKFVLNIKCSAEIMYNVPTMKSGKILYNTVYQRYAVYEYHAMYDLWYMCACLAHQYYLTENHCIHDDNKKDNLRIPLHACCHSLVSHANKHSSSTVISLL